MTGWLAVRVLAVLPTGGALVLSFAGLADLARSARISGPLAYLWPLTLDAAGAVASLIWLDRSMPADARNAARGLALSTILLSIGGNSLHHWLIDSGQRPHVVVQMGVAACAPAVLFAMLHVLQLASRRADQPATARPTSLLVVLAGVSVVRVAGPPLAAVEVPRLAGRHLTLAAPVTTTPPATRPASHRPVDSQPHTHRPASQQRGRWTDHIEAARRVLADQPAIGRPALAAELGVPTSQARKLLDHLAAETANHQPDLLETA